jgi:hypothetical protein
VVDDYDEDAGSGLIDPLVSAAVVATARESATGEVV